MDSCESLAFAHSALGFFLKTAACARAAAGLMDPHWRESEGPQKEPEIRVARSILALGGDRTQSMIGDCLAAA